MDYRSNGHKFNFWLTSLSGNNSRQVVPDHVPLLSNSINWYQQKLGSQQATNYVTHWPRVHGLAVSGRGLEAEFMATPTLLLLCISLIKELSYCISVMQIGIRNCLGCKEPIQLLEELSWQQSVTSVIKPQILSSSLSSSSSGHWMVQFPSQCILTIDAVLWERCVHNAIEKEDKSELKAHW